MHICDEETANTDLKDKFTADVVKTGSSFAARKQKVPAKKTFSRFCSVKFATNLQLQNGPLS